MTNKTTACILTASLSVDLDYLVSSVFFTCFQVQVVWVFPAFLSLKQLYQETQEWNLMKMITTTYITGKAIKIYISQTQICCEAHNELAIVTVIIFS